MNHARPRIGISSCLVGDSVRWDGGHKLDRELINALAHRVDWIPMCPEVEVGMGTPREPLQLMGKTGTPRLVGQDSAIDWTDAMSQLTLRRIEMFGALRLCGYILKAHSPSCGLKNVAVLSSLDVSRPEGRGLFAGTLTTMMPALPVEDELQLRDPATREAFMERVFAYYMRASGEPLSTTPQSGA